MVSTGEKGKEKNLFVSFMLEDILKCKWSIQILHLISKGFYRPSELLKNCKGLSAKVMNERLKKMLEFGILERKVFGEKPPIIVNYNFTDFGRKMLQIILDIKKLQEEFVSDIKKS